MRGRLLAGGAVAVALALQVVSGPWLARTTAGRDGEDALLYLPNGQHLQVLSLGRQALLADAIYLWAIQYYSNYEREDRYRYVRHVFGDVIAELDPQYIDPYWIGALILTTEARDLDAGLELLERGMAANPDEWILPYLAGWECYNFGAYERAQDYFDRAAVVPGAPPVVLRLRAGMVSKAGDLQGAIRMWREVLEDPRSDEASRAIARRRIRDLTVRADVEQLESVVARFRNRNGRPPRSLDELVRTGYLPFVPTDPDGRPYRLDPDSGRVASGAARLLGDR